MANRPDIIIKKNKICILIGLGIAAGKNVAQKKEKKRKDFINTDNTNVEHDMCDYTGNIMSQCNSNKRFQETFGSHTRKTFIYLLGTSHIIRKVLQS